MTELSVALVAGIIGITGTLLGAVITHWLDVRRDRIGREFQARMETRARLLDGVLSASERHGRAEVPFDGGDSLRFPMMTEAPEAILERIREEIREVDNGEKGRDVSDALQLVLERLHLYLRPDQPSHIPRLKTPARSERAKRT